MRRLKKDITKRGDVPTSPVLGKKLATPPASNTRSAGRAQTAKTIAAPRATTSKQNATAKGGKKQLGTMLVHQEESDEGQYPLSPPTTSRKTAEPSPMAAAAAGTLEYLKAYGQGEGGGSVKEKAITAPRGAGAAVESEEEVDVVDGSVFLSRSTKKSAGPKNAEPEEYVNDAEPEEEDDTERSESDISAAAGFDFSDDEDVLELHIDSDDDLFTSFPKNKLRKNMVLGGPQPPDPAGLMEDEYKKLYAKYSKERKRYTDKKRNEAAKRIQECAGGKPGRYSGFCDGQLRPLTEVDSHPLITGHTFPAKDILHLRIAEEAMHRGIVTKVVRSDVTNFVVIGADFYVRASFTSTDGWTANCVVCREGGDLLQIPPNDRLWIEEDTKKRSVMTPLKYTMVVPIILDAVSKKPGITYQSLREILKPYAKDYAVTDAILQDARHHTKELLFGSAEDNVQYADGVAAELRRMGHEVELLFGNRKETIQKVLAVVLCEEMARLKKIKQTMDAAQQKHYVKRWKKENKLFLNNVFGLPELEHHKRFLKAVEVFRQCGKIHSGDSSNGDI
jgi:hypothetical protein